MSNFKSMAHFDDCVEKGQAIVIYACGVGCTFRFSNLLSESRLPFRVLRQHVQDPHQAISLSHESAVCKLGAELREKVYCSVFTGRGKTPKLFFQLRVGHLVRCLFIGSD